MEFDRSFGILCVGTLGLMPARRVVGVRWGRLRNLGARRGKLLSSGFIDEREVGTRKLGGIDAAQLFLDPPPHFEGKCQIFGKLILRHFAIRVNELDQPGHRAHDGLAVAVAELWAE